MVGFYVIELDGAFFQIYIFWLLKVQSFIQILTVVMLEQLFGCASQAFGGKLATFSQSCHVSVTLTPARKSNWNHSVRSCEHPLQQCHLHQNGCYCLQMSIFILNGIRKAKQSFAGSYPIHEGNTGWGTKIRWDLDPSRASMYLPSRHCG